MKTIDRLANLLGMREAVVAISLDGGVALTDAELAIVDSKTELRVDVQGTVEGKPFSGQFLLGLDDGGNIESWGLHDFRLLSGGDESAEERVLQAMDIGLKDLPLSILGSHLKDQMDSYVKRVGTR